MEGPRQDREGGASLSMCPCYPQVRGQVIKKFLNDAGDDTWTLPSGERIIDGNIVYGMMPKIQQLEVSGWHFWCLEWDMVVCSGSRAAESSTYVSL